MKSAWFLLQGFPEMIGTIALAMAYARVKIRWDWAVFLGFCMSATVFFVRYYMDLFTGFHTLLIFFVMIVCLKQLYKTSILRSLFGVMGALATLIVLESLSNMLMIPLFHVSSAEAIADPRLWSLIGLPQAGLLLGLALILPRVLKPMKETHP